MEKQVVHLNGIDMVYEECGRKNDDTIVLLHGFCGSSHYWHKMCSRLSDNYRLIMPQLRGHGETSVPNGIYTMETMADDIAALMNELQIGKAVMLGHSLGGYVTLAFADSYEDRLSGFGLIHSTASSDSEEMMRKRMQDIDAIREAGMAAYMRDIVPKLFSESRLDKLDEEVERVIAIGEKMNPEGAIRTLKGMMVRPDRSKVLSNASFPVLMVAGTDDEVIPPDASFCLSDEHESETTFEYPHTSEISFENVGHMSLIEVPDQLARVIENYIKTLHEKEVKRVI